MALITWSDNFSVKVKQFDDQHKKLVDIVNQLHDAMKTGKGKDVLGNVLQSLISYTASHFADEEKLMKLHAYPGYENHKKEHNALVAQVLDFQKKFKEGNALISQNIMNFLRDWLMNHISAEDKKYGVYLNTKNVR